MSKDTNTGGPAFPFVMPSDSGHIFAQGMSLRDYFAAKAMQGICANEVAQGLTWESVAYRAYTMANAMLTARGETK